MRERRIAYIVCAIEEIIVLVLTRTIGHKCLVVERGGIMIWIRSFAIHLVRSDRRLDLVVL